MSINIIHNPITSTALLKLRDKKSHSKLFREGLLLLSEIIAYEAGKKLKTKKVKVKSVLEDTEQDSISDDIVLIPILRAGLGMTNGFLKVYENAIIAPLGLALYWLMNNILMIIERLVINKFLNKEEAKENA